MAKNRINSDLQTKYSIKNNEKVVLRWWRNRKGRPLFPHKFIKRTFECWAISTKQLLKAGRGHQTARKAAHPLLKEVGQNIKDKKRDKRVRTESRPEEEIVKEEKFPNRSKPSHQRICGEFSNIRGQHNQEKRKTNKQTNKKTKKQNKTKKNTEYRPNCNC